MKALEMQSKGTPLIGVYSAYAKDSLKGCLYVEADNPQRVQAALSGFPGIKFNDIVMVPLKEMSQVFLTGESDDYVPKKGDWVRVRRGKYKDDVGIIHGVEDQQGKVQVRLVPRIDLEAAIKGGHPFGGKQKRRPLARLIDREEIESKGGEVGRGIEHGTFRFNSDLFMEGGFVLKTITINQLVTGSAVKPSLGEMKEFKSLAVDEDESGFQRLSLQAAQTRAENLAVGDRVLVIAGDLVNITGTVKTIDGDTAEILPNDTPLSCTTIHLEKSKLLKKFSIGETVKIESGLHKGETGLITVLDEAKSQATVFTPSSASSIVCSLDSIRACPENSGGGNLGILNGILVGDMVTLSNHEVGIVLRIDSNRTFQVMSSDGLTKTVEPSQATKRTSRLAAALDSDGQQFMAESSVDIISGPLKGKAGRVAHIFGTLVFLRMKGLSRLDGGNYAVVESSGVRVVGQDPTTLGQLTNKTYLQQQIASGHGAERPARGRGGGRGRGRGRLVGQNVKVVRGPNKGIIGAIEVEMGDRLRVMLDANMKSTEVGKSDVVLLDSFGNQTLGAPAGFGGAGRGSGGVGGFSDLGGSGGGGFVGGTKDYSLSSMGASRIRSIADQMASGQMAEPETQGFEDDGWDRPSYTKPRLPTVESQPYGNHQGHQPSFATGANASSWNQPPRPQAVQIKPDVGLPVEIPLIKPDVDRA
eukprot:GHVN01083353.1.p1 GENE.GHVN01083353.1~~GHVN01083353.1.p1  ORF type:complete len:699 (+),score=75.82 GHVN01083353.1:1082-3178(+)